MSWTTQAIQETNWNIDSNYMLLESGGYLLLEDGVGKILLFSADWDKKMDISTTHNIRLLESNSYTILSPSSTVWSG